MSDSLTSFPTAQISLQFGTYEVPCEPIAPGLAITPCFTYDGPAEDKPPPILGGGFYITHLPTSTTIPDNQACIECCRAAGRRLAGMEIDWSAVDAEGTQTLVASLEGRERDLLVKAVHIMRGCSQRGCYHDDAES
jgi:hypothetical protein